MPSSRDPVIRMFHVTYEKTFVTVVSKQPFGTGFVLFCSGTITEFEDVFIALKISLFSPYKHSLFLYICDDIKPC